MNVMLESCKTAARQAVVGFKTLRVSVFKVIVSQRSLVISRQVIRRGLRDLGSLI